MSSFWPHNLVMPTPGGGLEDLEDILSAPPPALGAPLQRWGGAKHTSAQVPLSDEARAGGSLQPVDHSLPQSPALSRQSKPDNHPDNGGTLVGRSFTGAASVSPEAGPMSKTVRPNCNNGRSAAYAGPSAADLVEEQSARLANPARGACQEACCDSRPEAPLLSAASATLGASEGLACILPRPDEPAPAAQAGMKQGRTLWASLQAPELGAYEGMTIAASLAGAVAGGAAAGPLGVSLGGANSVAFV